MKTVYYLIFAVVFCTTSSYGDFLLLRNSQSAQTKILDTTGCDITISRNGNNVKIAKNLIDYIIIGGRDTLHYEEYVCNKIPKPVIRYEDTPEYTILAIINNTNFPQSDAKVDTGSTVAFLPQVLQGNNDSSIVTAFRAAMQLSTRKIKIQDITKDSLVEVLKGHVTKCRYAFVIKRIEEVLSDNGRIYSSAAPYSNTNMGIGNIGIGNSGNVITIGEIVLIDLIKRTIVFSAITTSNKGIWKRKPSTIEEIVLSSEEKKKMADEGTERAKERGSDRVKDKIVDTLKVYFDTPRNLKWYNHILEQ